MENKRSQSTGIDSNSVPEPIRRWVWVYTHKNEPKIKLTLLKIIVPDNVDDEEWMSLENHIDIARELAIDNWKAVKEEKSKKTFSDMYYNHIYFYDEPHPEVGVIIEKRVGERRKTGTKKFIESTEEVAETFLQVEQKEPKDNLWIDDDVLDDLLDRNIDSIRIIAENEMYFVDTNLFLTYGKMKNKKVYIDIRNPPFTVEEFHYTKGVFNVFAPVI